MIATDGEERRPIPDAQFTLWPSLVDTVGTFACSSWSRFFSERLKRPSDFLGDKQHPGWSPATFDPSKRKDENVKALTALVLDSDGGTTLEQAETLWWTFFGFIHTTRKHTAAAPRFRVVLPLSRFVTPAEHARLWQWADERAGHKLDGNARDASRFWYLPGSINGEFETRELGGELLDVDAVLAELASSGPDEPPPQAKGNGAPPPHTNGAPPPGRVDVAERARRYVGKMPPAISGQGGHGATFRVACVLVRGFALPRHAARTLLDEYNRRCEPPWNERALEHKIESAERNAKFPMGYLIEDERRDWRSYVRDEPPRSEPASEAPTHQWPTAAERARRLGDRGAVLLPTKLATLDGAARGGLRSGSVVVFGGAPGAGKTTLCTQLALEYAQAGHAVAIVAADEGADGLLIRIGQGLGFSREALERGDASSDLAEKLAELPNLALVDSDESGATIEEVSQELARTADGRPSVLIVDSIQTGRVLGMDLADGPRARVNLVVDALKVAAKRQGHLVLATCELARGAYRSQNVADRIDDLAAFKESGGIEYGATMALVLRNAPGDGSLVDVAIAKNRIGKKLPFRLELDHQRAAFKEVALPAEGAATPVQAMRARILRAIDKSIEPITSKAELARRVKARNKAVSPVVDEMLEEGELEMVEKAFRLPCAEAFPSVPERSGNAGIA